MVYSYVDMLIGYGLKTGLLDARDAVYAKNRLYAALCLDGGGAGGVVEDESLEAILEHLLDYAAETGLITDSTHFRDLFDTRLMGILTPPPSRVIDKFYELYFKDPAKATNFYYKFSQDSDYIRRYRMAKDIRWETPTEYGVIDMTINLAKPEKDPRAIAAAAKTGHSGYPKCLLCRENEGFAGDAGRPARQNHRVIPIKVTGEDWFLQYSPYVYYNEHCIVLSGEHRPMKVDKSAFDRLLEFLTLFPHYFIGSNADLPIVGGSILSHDHFQGGNYTFAMAKAPVEERFELPSFKNVSAGILKWPLSVIRLNCDDPAVLSAASTHILKAWRGYTDESAFIFAYTDGVPHNTITPIARMRGGGFEMDLALRNNITTSEHPYGVFHPHEELHHIKKENIGLIEAMGLAVLPARLKDELSSLKDCILSGGGLSADESIAPHAEWAEEFLTRHNDFNDKNAGDIINEEVARVFVRVLEDSGVYKRDKAGRAAMMRFIATL